MSPHAPEKPRRPQSRLKGTAVANHDESRFPGNPEGFDITRDRRGMVGQGLHRWLGAPPSLLEGTVVLEQLLHNFAEFGWDPSRVVRDDSSFIGGPHHRPILATPGCRHCRQVFGASSR